MSSILALLLATGAPVGEARSTAAAAEYDDLAAVLDDYNDCGMTALCLVCRIKDPNVDWQRVKSLLGPHDSAGNRTFANLSATASQLNLYPVGLRAELADLTKLPMPAIVQTKYFEGLDTPHFSVLLATTSDGIYLLDAPYPPLFYTWSEFRLIWSGPVLVFAETESEAEALRNSVDRAHFALTEANIEFVASAIIVVLIILMLPYGSIKRITLATVQGCRQLFASRTAAVLGMILLSLLSLVAYLCFFTHDSSPAVTIEKTVFDLGELPIGEQTVPVVLHNHSDRPVLIDSVRSSCTCAAVNKPDRIDAGQDAVISVSLQVHSGPRSAQLVLHTSDSDSPKTLTFNWFGTARPLLVPNVVVVPEARLGAVMDRVVRIIYPGGGATIFPEVKDIVSDNPLIEMSVIRNEPQAYRMSTSATPYNVLGAVELRIRCRSPASPQQVVGLCQMSVKYGEGETRFSLPVTVRFVAPIVPETDRVVFSARNARELTGMKRAIGVRQEADSKITVRKVPSWLHAEVRSTSARDAQLELKVLHAPDRADSKEVVLLGLESNTELAVPIEIRTLVVGVQK